MPRLPEIEKKPYALSEYMIGSWRPLQLVALVRVDLVHHVDQRIAARDEQALLAIGREMHVVAVERGLGGDGDRLLAGALHVEAGLPCRCERYMRSSKMRTVTMSRSILRSVSGSSFGSHGPTALMVVAEHADEVASSAGGSRRRRAGIGPRRGARGGNVHRRKVGRVAGPERRLGHVQRELRRVAAQAWVLVAHVSPARALSPGWAMRQLVV